MLRIQNKYDNEASRVELEGLRLVNYVANTPVTVIGENYSVDRLYNKIPDTSEGVFYIIPSGVLCFTYTILSADLADTSAENNEIETKLK